MAKIKIYCDESRQDSPKYKLLGSIWLPADLGQPFVDEFFGWCQTHVGGLPRHMKWTNCPPRPDSHYMLYYVHLVDMFFSNIERGMRFRTIIADNDYDFAHPWYHGGDPEVGFWKLYYQLLLHPLNEGNEYHIRIAQRTVSKKVANLELEDRLTDLRNALNNGFRKRCHYEVIDDIVAPIEARPARSRLLIQLADILTGAVGFHWHLEHLKDDAKPGKLFLAKHIARHLGRDDLLFRSLTSDSGFNIFRFKPRRAI